MKRWWILLVLVILPILIQVPDAKEFDEKKASHYLTILLKRPTNPYLFERVYALYSNGGKLEALVGTLQKQGAETKDPAFWIILGRIYQRQFQSESALKAFEKAVELKPNHYPYLFLLGKAYSEKNRNPEALKTLLKAMSLAERPQDKREVLTLLGSLYILEGNREKALEAWQGILKAGQVSLPVLKVLLGLYEKNNFYEEALKLTQEVIRRSADNIKVQYQMKLKMASLYEKTRRIPKAVSLYKEILRNTVRGHWLRSEAVQGLFELHKKEGTLNELKKYYREQIKKEPGEVDHYVLMTRVLTELQDEELEDFLQKSLQQFPQEVSLYNLLIDHYEKTEQIGSLINTLKKLYSLKPGRMDLILKGCRIYLEKEALAEALGLAKILMEKYPQKGFASYQLAKLFYRFKKSKEALEFAKEALKALPTDRRIITLAGKLYFENKEKEKALATWKTLAPPGSQDLEAIYDLAQILYEHKFYNPALDFLEKTLQKNPLAFKFLYLKALCLRKLKKDDEAIESFRKAYQNAQTPLGKKRLRKALIDIYAKAGLIQKVLEEFKSALEKNPGKIDLMEALAEIYERARELEKSEALYREILKKNPKHLEAHQALARLYRGRDDQLAIKQYLELAKINPTQRARYYLEIGNLYYSLYSSTHKREYQEKSEDYYDKASNTKPLTDRICGALGKAYWQNLGKREKAKKLYQQAIKGVNRGIYYLELGDLYAEEKAYEKALEQYGNIFAKASIDANLAQQALSRVYKYSLENLAEEYQKKKEYPKAAKMFEKISSYSGWKREQKATLLCRLIESRSHIEKIEAQQLLLPLQEVLTKYSQEIVKIDQGYSVKGLLFCHQIYQKLSDKLSVSYERLKGEDAKKEFTRAFSPDVIRKDRTWSLEKILERYPFSRWAGKAALELAKENKHEPNLAQEYYRKILQGRYASEREIFYEALLGYYQSKKNQGEGREAFEYLKKYSSRYPQLASLIQREKKAYPFLPKILAKVSPPLTLKWKQRVARYSCPPLFHRDKVYYPASEDSLYSYDLSSTSPSVDSSKPVVAEKIPSPFKNSRIYYFRYFQGVFYGDTFIYGGSQLTGYDIQNKKTSWKVEDQPESVELKLVDGQVLKAELLGRSLDTLYFKDEKGKEHRIKTSQVKEMAPQDSKTPNLQQKLYQAFLQKRLEVRKLEREWRKDSRNQQKYQAWRKAQEEYRKLNIQLQPYYRRYGYPSRTPSLTSFFSQPLIHKKRVIVYEALRRWLFCIEADSGKVLWFWKLALGGVYQSLSTNPGYLLNQHQPQMKIRGNRLYILADKLYGLSLSTGRVQWIRTIPTYSSSTYSSASSFVLLKNRIYVALKSPRKEICIYDLQGRLVGRRAVKDMINLYAGEDLLCALSSRQMEVWSGKELEDLKGGTLHSFNKSYFSLNSYLNSPPHLVISGNCIYLLPLGWIQVYEYTKNAKSAGSLRLIWEDEEMKKERQNRYSRYQRRPRSYSYYVYYNSGLQGPYIYQGSLYVLSSNSGYLMAYKSMRDVEREIVAKLQKNPKDPEAYLRLAGLYMKAKKLSRAIDYYKKVLPLTPGSSKLQREAREKLYRIYFAQGSSLFSQKKFAGALKHFQETLQYSTTKEEKTRSILFSSWIYHLKFQEEWIGKKLMAHFFGGPPIFSGNLQMNLHKALRGYMGVLDQELVLSLSDQGEEKVNSLSFIEGRIGDLVKIPLAGKAYEKLSYPGAYAQFHQAKSPEEFEKIFSQYPYSKVGVDGLKRAAELYLADKDYGQAIETLGRLKGLLKSHSFSGVARKDILWSLGKAYLAGDRPESALDYFYALEHDYLYEGKSLTFDMELAKSIAQAQEDLAEKNKIAPPLKQKWSSRARTSSYYHPQVRLIHLQNRIFFMGRTHQISVYNSSTGREERTLYISHNQSYYPGWSPFWLTSSPSHLFCTMGDRIKALDGRTLRWTWEYIEKSPQRSPREFAFRLEVMGPYLFALSSDGHLYSFRASSGKLLWKKKVSSGTQGYYLNPLTRVHNSSIITYTENYPLLMAQEEQVVLIGDQVRCYDAYRGNLLWTRSLATSGSPSRTSLQIYKGLSRGKFLFFSDTLGNQWALDWRKGETLWKTRSGTGQPAFLSSTSRSLGTLTQLSSSLLKLEIMELHSGRKTFSGTLAFSVQPNSRYKDISFHMTESHVYIFYDRIYVFDLRQATNQEVPFQNKKTLTQKAKLVWQSPLRPVYSSYRACSPLVSSEKIYIIEPNGVFFSYESGK